MIQSIRQLLVFQLSLESYGVSLASVQEIRTYSAPLKLARSHPVVSGVIELRGLMVPVVDLRRVFNMGSAAVTTHSVIVVMLVAGRTVGLLVDQVADVLDVDPAQERSVPGMAHLVEGMCLNSIVTADDRMVMVIDHVRLFEKLAVALESDDPASQPQREPV